VGLPARWKIAVFDVRTGRIQHDDMPITGIPTFTRQINNEGAISVTIQPQDPGVPPQTTLRGMLAPWRFGLAVYRGNTIVQAGPIVDVQVPDNATPQVNVQAKGIWGLFTDKRLLVNPTYTLSPTTSGATLALSAAGDTTYTRMALHDIAAHLISDNMSRGTAYQLPIDIPTDVGGTQTRTYALADLAMVGARLADLTQEVGGPDIDFKPYFDPANPGYIRWSMRIGNPILQQAGAQLFFDQLSSFETFGVDVNGANLATDVILKGTSSTNAPTAVMSQSTTLTAGGYPALDMVDSSHNDSADPVTMQGWADGDLALYSYNVETWTSLVRIDANAPDISSYDPGTYATFTVSQHWWEPPGQYQQRILGFSQGTTQDNMAVILQAVQGML
jgi:hypothetical protein